MKKEVGIVIESIKKNRITGKLAFSKADIDLDECGRLMLNHQINGICFELNAKTGHYSIYVGSYENAMEVGRKLKEIGFSPLTLVFNKKEIPIE